TKQLARGGVGAEKARFQVLIDVRDRRFLVEISESLLALAEHLLSAEAIEFGRSARGEDAEDEEAACFLRHRLAIEDGQVPEDCSLHVAQRDTEITLNAHSRKRSIRRKEPPGVDGMVAQTSADDVFARGAANIPSDVLHDLVVPEIRQRANGRIAEKL